MFEAIDLLSVVRRLKAGFFRRAILEMMKHLPHACSTAIFEVLSCHFYSSIFMSADSVTAAGYFFTMGLVCLHLRLCHRLDGVFLKYFFSSFAGANGSPRGFSFFFVSLFFAPPAYGFEHPSLIVK